MSEPDAEASAFKAYLLQRSRNPEEVASARDRALFACLVIPEPVQKWMVDIGAVEPLLDSIEATIVEAEKHARNSTQ